MLKKTIAVMMVSGMALAAGPNMMRPGMRPAQTNFPSILALCQQAQTDGRACDQTVNADGSIAYSIEQKPVTAVFTTADLQAAQAALDQAQTQVQAVQASLSQLQTVSQSKLSAAKTGN